MAESIIGPFHATSHASPAIGTPSNRARMAPCGSTSQVSGKSLVPYFPRTTEFSGSKTMGEVRGLALERHRHHVGDRLRVLVDGDGDDRHVFAVFDLLGELREERQLFEAGFAGLRPEMEDDHLARVVRQFDATAAVRGEIEVGGRAIVAHVLRPQLHERLAGAPDLGVFGHVDEAVDGQAGQHGEPDLGQPGSLRLVVLILCHREDRSRRYAVGCHPGGPGGWKAR